MATLSGNKIKNTYQSLVKFSDNGNITTSAKQLTDGFGNNSPMFVSTTQVGIGVTPESGLNLHVFGDAKIGSNLTVIGNLVVEGSTTTVGTDTLTVKDPLIVLANNNTSTDAVDIGFYGKYHPSDTTLYSGLFREALTGKYRLFKGLEVEPTTTVNTSGTGYAVASLVANLEGNVTGGTISGTTGDFSGDITADAFYLNGMTAGSGALYWTSDRVTLANYNSSGILRFETGGGTNALTLDDSQNATFAASVSASFFKGDVYANDGTSKILENGTDGTDATFTGDVTGGLTGDVTGNVTGDLTGDVTGDITGNVTATSVLADGVTATTQSADDNSTKVATTAYVDALEVSSTLSEILANGNTSGANDIIMADLRKIYFGTDSDFELSHNTSGNSIVQHLGTGTLFIRNNTSEQVVKLQAKNSIDVINDYVIINGETERTEFGKDVEIKNGNELYFHDALEIWHNANNSNIINNTGNLIITQKTDDGDIIFKSDNGSGDVTEYFRVDGGDERVIYGRSIQMADNVSVYFGNTIANDGYIKWDSTASELFVNGPVKVLETLDVVGNSTFAGNITIGTGVINPSIGGDIAITQGSIGLRINDAASAISPTTATSNNDNAVDLGVSNIRFKNLYLGGSITSGGGATFAGNVTVNGGGIDIDNDDDVRLRFDNAGTFKAGLQVATTAGDMIAGSAVNDFAIRSQENMLFSTGGNTERMRIDSSGNVGIGATSPAVRLDFGSATGKAFHLYTSGTDYYGFNMLQYDSGPFSTNIIAGDGGEIKLRTASGSSTQSTRLTVAAGGNVGIGTTSPNDALEVAGNSATTHRIRINNANSSGSETLAFVQGTTFKSWVEYNNSNGNFDIWQYTNNNLRFGTNNTERMRINSSGVTTLTAEGYQLAIKDESSGNISEILTSNTAMGFFADRADAVASTSMIFSIDNDTKMTIDSSGNVGIGNSNPQNKLDIEQSAAVSARLLATGATSSSLKLEVKGGATQLTTTEILANSSGALTFATGTTSSTEKMHIDSSGNVGIGTTSPGTYLQLGDYPSKNISQTSYPDIPSEHMLHISAPEINGHFGGGISFGEDAFTAANIVVRDAGAAGSLDLCFGTGSANGMTEKMRLTNGGDLHVDGDVVAYSTTISDKRLKDNVKPLESSLDKVMSLKGVEYVWNNGSRKGQKDIGFIAQEVEDVIPEIVREKQVIFNEEEKYKTVDYEKITAVLVEAVKELKAEVEELKKQIK